MTTVFASVWCKPAGRGARSFFFFQAEDGIRDYKVTGVQTCALPILFRTHADAPRVLLANSNLVARWADWEHFNALDRKGLMMFGQMTAGSWIYIGTDRKSVV